MRIPNKEISSILIIKNDKIGDMVLSTCIFRELKKAFPSSKITIIASQSNFPLIEKNPYIDKILIQDYPPRGLSGLFSYYKLSKKLKSKNFDLGIDLRGSIFNILFFLNLAKIKYKIGFYNRFFSKIFVDFAYKKDRKNSHVTFQRLDLINKALNLNLKDYWPDIHTDLSDSKALEKLISQYKLNKFICLLPDSSLEKKQWSLNKWDVLIKDLQKKYPQIKILVLGIDNKKILFLKKQNPKIIIFEKPLPLRVLYLLFKKASLTICHDGGTMHLAWAGNSNLLALMEKSLPVNYVKPLGKNSHIIETEIKSLSVSSVLEKIDKILKNKT